MGQLIDIAEDGKFKGYLALPEAKSGPGLVMLPEIFGINATMRQAADLYAQEGYVVLVPDLFWRLEPGLDLGFDPKSFETALGYYKRFDFDQGVKDIGTALGVLKARPECTGKVGAIGFCMGGLMAYLTAARLPVDVAASFYGGSIDKYLGEVGNIRCPMVLHFGVKDDMIPPESVEKIKQAFAGRPDVSIHTYPDAGHGFYLPGRQSYHRPSAWLAHSPTIGLLRQAIGPRYDLNALWNRHCECEFGIRDAAETMKTMVAEPYVNHIPTMTGGVGQEDLHRFYATHFIPRLPKDTKLIPISRTIGSDRIVDELLFCFTHDTVIDFMLPGVAPTGKYVQIPTVAIVCFRGNKLYHEHIYWDQASLLVQIGLLDPKNLPVAGIETAKKVLDERLPSNALLKRGVGSIK